ncbi:MAG: OmpA family protein [Gammaproteobacteria bacterium]|nr:OmpA family protein [Gammaproteobacteria bacterium]
MTATTEAAVAEQRDAQVEKIDLEVERKVNLGNRLLQHHRAILQDLPFNGMPELLTDDHRAAIDRLVEKHGHRNLHIRVKRIVGYASSIGDAQNNLLLSQQRAQAVHQYLLGRVTAAGIDPDEIFSSGFAVIAKGESDLPVPTQPDADHPLNRRVEIVYLLTIDLPAPPDAASGPTSTLWKIDFGPAGAGFFLQAGAGKLTMLPDGGEGSPSEEIEKNFTFEQLGFSIGLFEKLKKAKFLQRFPLLRRALGTLHPDKPGNYPKTSALLQNIGFSVDLVSVGGEFQTDLRLSFAELQSFNFNTLSASLSILGKGEASLLILHNGHFFSPTVILGVGQNIAVPDVEAGIVPIGFVQVNLAS